MVSNMKEVDVLNNEPESHQPKEKYELFIAFNLDSEQSILDTLSFRRFCCKDQHLFQKHGMSLMSLNLVMRMIYLGLTLTAFLQMQIRLFEEKQLIKTFVKMTNYTNIMLLVDNLYKVVLVLTLPLHYERGDISPNCCRNRF